MNKSVCRLMLAFLLIASGLTGNAGTPLQQSTNVKGTVTDAQGIPLPGVTVKEKGTQNGVATDFDGNYSIDVSSSTSTLTFSFVGMSTTEQPVGGRATINLQMEDDAQTLDEVILVGYGTQTRKEVTTAVTKVTAEDFNQGVVASPLELIQGKVAGLSITRPGGNNPNSGSSIQLRGVTSLEPGGSNPLIVIDGIPGGNLDLLQQNDIESFDVLKDGAAAAIYGSRGNAGVILITTKKGKKGVTTFNYSTYLSKDFANSKPDFLSAEQYRGVIEDRGLNPNLDLGASTDIFDELINDTNISQYHNFVASGGGENSSYRVSMYYRNLEGIARENTREELGVRASFNQSGLDDRFHVQASIANNFRDSNLQGGGDGVNNLGGQFGIVTDWNPTAPIRAPFEDREGELQNQGQFGFYQPSNGFNPFSEYANRLNLRKQQTFSGDVKFDFEVVKEKLTLSVFGSYQSDNFNDRQYRGTEDWEQYQPGSRWLGTGFARKFNRLDYTKTVEPTINYEEKFGNSTIKILGGFSYQKSTTETFVVENSGFTTNAFKDWNLSAGNAITNILLPRPVLDSFKEDNTLIAYFTRFNYSFMERYFLQASIRYEGSSRFGANNKWGTFPAISGGWLVSDENFMQGVDFVNSLKLRAGYGVTGFQGIPNYRSLLTLGEGGLYPIFLEGANSATYYQTYGANINPNPDLKWENKKEINIGIDFGLFGNRLTGAIDIYNRITEDLLLDYTVPQPPFVQDRIYTNVGTVENKGIELVLGIKMLRTEDFSWNVDLTGSYQENNLKTLSNQTFAARDIFGGSIGNPGFLGDAIRNQEGGPIGDFYGKRFAGFTKEGQWLFYKADGTVVRTDETTEEDKAIIGNGLPKYFASITNTFKYKNFDLTIFFRGKFDYDILNTVDLFYGNPNLLPGNVLTSALGKYSQISETPQYSDYYLESGDFVKLDNITLGYNFDMGTNSPFSGVRIYGSARNVATITGYGGRDPEVQDTGLFPGVDDRNFYPRTMTVTTGINLTF